MMNIGLRQSEADAQIVTHAHDKLHEVGTQVWPQLTLVD